MNIYKKKCIFIFVFSVIFLYFSVYLIFNKNKNKDKDENDYSLIFFFLSFYLDHAIIILLLISKILTNKIRINNNYDDNFLSLVHNCILNLW